MPDELRAYPVFHSTRRHNREQNIQLGKREFDIKHLLVDGHDLGGHVESVVCVPEQVRSTYSHSARVQRELITLRD
jgi:hypothetical protein